MGKSLKNLSFLPSIYKTFKGTFCLDRFAWPFDKFGGNFLPSAQGRDEIALGSSGKGHWRIDFIQEMPARDNQRRENIDHSILL
jgi:hypothetical protein